MDFDCLLTEPACAKEMFDAFTVFCGVFFSVGALMLQWSFYDPNPYVPGKDEATTRNGPEGRDRSPEHLRGPLNNNGDFNDVHTIDLC